MKKRVANVFAWICIGLVSAFNLFAAVMKFVPIVPGSEGDLMMQRLGVGGMEYGLGVLEFVLVVLYVVPRTSTVGTVLMGGYLAGALATNLTHGFTHAEAAPIYVLFVLMFIGAWIRNPELFSRLFKKPYPKA